MRFPKAREASFFCASGTWKNFEKLTFFVHNLTFLQMSIDEIIPCTDNLKLSKKYYGKLIFTQFRTLQNVPQNRKNAPKMPQISKKKIKT